MANKTISIGFKIEEVEGGFKKVTMDAEDLRKVMTGVVKETETAKGKFVNFASASIGIDAIKNSFSELQKITKGLSDAYSVQIEAETKLTTVMRQRMGATDEQIQGIKDLCSAQQQLGVIGDEIQLAGAQQLSTFLSQKKALETLIPAMNNLVAQQKGLNATSGDAVTIGNLLGKAMQGQTSALRRVGITFTEAEERAVKYGTEQQRAAALARIIKNNVGEMNAELAKTDAGRMKQVSNNVGDLQERMGRLTQKLMPGITLINQMVLAGTNIKKVTMAFSALTPAIRKMGATMKAETVTVKTLGASLTRSSVMGKAAVVSLAATVKAAMWTIKTAFISTVVGAAIWAIGEGLALLVEKLNGVSAAAKDAGGSVDKLKAAQDQMKESLASAQSQLTLHISEIENFKGTKEQERKKIEELNSTYGTTMGYFSSLNGWYKALQKNSEAYCRQIALEAQARSLADQIAEKSQDRYDMLYNPDGTPKKVSKKRETKTAIEHSDYGFAFPWQIKKRTYEITGTSQADELRKNYNASLAETVELEKRLAKISKEMAANAMPVRGSATAPNLSGNGNLKKADEVLPAGSIADLQKQISDIDKKVKYSIDSEEIAELELQKQALEKRIGDLKLYATIRLDAPRMEEVEKELACRPLKLGIEIDSESLDKTMQDIPEAFKKINNDTNGLSKSLGGIAEIAGQAGQAFSSMGKAFEVPELDAAGIIAGTIATILQSFASALAQSSPLGPIGWAAFGLAGLAQVTAMVSQIKSISKFADGGIAYGPTLGLFGEYAGAASNPEVVAPLNKLRSMIEPAQAAPVVIGGDIRIKGSDLVIALKNKTRIGALSGRHSGIR